MLALSAAFVVVLALVHVLGGRLRMLRVTPRSRWLSLAGGISVAYVFVHVLPDLAAGEEALRAAVRRSFGFLELHVYLLALTGMVVFYGLERMARTSRRRQGVGPGVFWLHVSSFALYNALIGYLLLHREKPGLTSLVFFFVAMATHFVVNDFGLHQAWEHRYDRYGRWMLAGAVLLGWTAGALTKVPPPATAALFGFLAGGVVLNVLKEELPEERESRFSAFLAGAALYAAVLILI